MNKDILLARLEKVKNKMIEKEIDYLILSTYEDFLYLTGFKVLQDERMHLMIITKQGELYFVLPEMSKEIFQKNIIYGDIFSCSDSENPAGFLRKIVKDNNAIIAVDDKMWSAHLLRIQEVCPNAKFIRASELMSDIRIIKGEEEIKKLEKIADITEKVIEKIINEVTVGMTEKQLSTRIEFLFKELGAEDISFLPLVASGANAAIPHHIPSNKKIQKGEFVIFDIGGISAEGYRSDITRTICLGEPTDEMKKVYEIVKNAHEAACKEVSLGKKCFEIDKAARDVIKNMNYGEYFTHRTGHGIGLDFHEPPFLLDNNERLIDPGMAFSIEPGIYLPEKFGARIEDIGVVTVNGFKILTNFTRELIIK